MAVSLTKSSCPVQGCAGTLASTRQPVQLLLCQRNYASEGSSTRFLASAAVFTLLATTKVRFFGWRGPER
jgi:hypothetical protein